MEEEEEEHHNELQFLTNPPSSSNHPPLWPSMDNHFEPPSLDLQLSINVNPPNTDNCVVIRKFKKYKNDTKALKWQASEQIRLAAMEKAYAERVRELTRREMEIAQSEFARAHSMWERAREEVERAERMKKMATRRIDSTCMEITCQSCRQKFRP